MESGAIADFQITASSAHDMGNVGPQHGRYVLLSFQYVEGGYWRGEGLRGTDCSYIHTVCVHIVVFAMSECN